MKVLCVGRNYARHARELGATVPDAPIWFLKPETSVIGDGEAIVIPDGIGEVHHEVELAVRIGTQARNVGGPQALRHVDGYAVAIDVTARTLQEQAKVRGEPWARSKGYDTFCPVGPFHDPHGIDPQALDLRLWVDGDLRQQGTTADMVWSVAALLAKASAWTTLRPGDLLLTGTPEGVGPIRAGQSVEAEAGGLSRVRCRVRPA